MDKTYPTLELVVKLFKHYEYFYITATTGGTHAPGSYHYRGEAIDVGSGLEAASANYLKAAKTDRFTQMNALASWLYLRSSLITEEVHTKNLPGYPGGWYVKNEVRVSRYFYGLSTVQAHRNHVHLAVATQPEADMLLTIVTQAALGLTQDGVKGPKTTSAIKLVQKSAGIAQDGVVGPKTVAAIRAHLGWVKVS